MLNGCYIHLKNFFSRTTNLEGILHLFQEITPLLLRKIEIFKTVKNENY